jgi:hypothetical protein
MAATILFIQSNRRVRTFNGNQLAVDAENDRRADFDMNIRCAATGTCEFLKCVQK